MKIYLVTRSLSGVVGGVERQLGNIALRLVESNHDVSILSSDSENIEVFYPLLSQFSLLTYGQRLVQKSSKNTQRAKRQISMYQLIRQNKPDLIIAFMLSGYIVSLPTAILTRTPIVLAERNSPDVYDLTRARKCKYLYFLLMRISAGITVQLDTYKKRYPKFLRSRIKVIYNEIIVSSNEGRQGATEHPFTFGFVGRFSFQKQPVRLIESFARHIASGSNSHLVFIGKGELELEMRNKITNLNLENCVTILAPIKEMSDIYSSFDALCLPSLWEGFPNVVGEAMMYGLPVLGNRNCLGLSELVTNETGVLIDFEDKEVDGFTVLRAGINDNKFCRDVIHQHIGKFQKFNFVKAWNQVAIDATR
jgi:GalNAc-alpha-(1->4)-GalNAc-alpha-(1->3)-diNAcBac-PP-undecaprenol alpha-1,4-N-acetyl-D-galactosaminyltransferase